MHTNINRDGEEHNKLIPGSILGKILSIID